MNISKSILILALFVCVSSYSFSQSVNIGIGYNIGIHTKVGGLDYVVGRYNDTRSWLKNKMETPGFFRGMSYSMDFYDKNSLMTFEWIGRKSDLKASGVSSSGDYTRDYRFKMNSWNFGLGRKMKKKAGAKGNYLGMDFNMIIIKNYTRLYSTGDKTPEYQQISSWDLSLGIAPFIQHVGSRFTTKVYYQLSYLKNDYWEANRVINSATWSSDPYEKLEGNSRSLGICVKYNLVKNK
jgi:hypothetical protein